MEEQTTQQTPATPTANSSSMGKVIGVVIVVIVLGTGALLLLQNKSAKKEEALGTKTIQQAHASPTAALSTTPSTTSAMQEKKAIDAFTVTGANFSFDPKELTVKKGDTVKITFKNSEGFHDFNIDELNVKSGRIASGTDTTMTFVADKAGTFQYYCSVGNHRAMGMWGNLIVQ